MFRFLRGQTIERGNESERRLWPWKVMAFHQMLRQKKVADRRQNGGEQNANGGFALVEQIAHKIEREGGIASRQGIAELENNCRPRNGHQRAHLLSRDRALRGIERQLFQLVRNNAGIASGGKD